MRHGMLALVVFMMVLAACAGAAGQTPPAALEGTAWVLERLRGQPPIAGSTITLEFESGRLGGSAGCNGYGGPYQVEGDQLTVGELARTLMYCQDPAGLMDQEDGFLEALATVARYRTTAGRLELLDGAGQVVLALVPPPPTPAAALEGTEWVLTTLLDGAAAASILDGTEITLRLEQGRAAGTAGCNSYGGSYNRQGDALEIGALVRTEMFCQDPAGLMEQEDHYLDLLQRATSLELDGDQLTLRAPDGTGLVFRAR